MSFVQKTYNLWSDLEDTYKDKGNGLSKNEFLLKLVGYKDGSTVVDTLKTHLMKEYEGSEEICDMLIKILDAVAVNIDIIKTADIQDLNKYVASLVTSNQTANTALSGSLTKELFDGINPMLDRTKQHTVNLEQIFLLHNVLTDFFEYDGTKDVFSLVDHFNDPNVIIIKSRKSMNVFIERFKKEADDFFNKSHLIILDLLKRQKMPNHLILVSKEIYRKRGNVVTLYPQGAKIQMELKDTVKIDGVEFYKCQYSSLTSIDVYCVI